MIGLVIVSHSTKLAEGARELADQMTQGKVPIAIAGGVDDPDNPIGTDPIRVMEAITEVYHEDGVIVLMDLGSALMSAETALEFIDPEWQSNIYLCDAPLIEGIVSAAVQVMVGSSIDVVMSEARSALESKQLHLSPVVHIQNTPTPQTETLGADAKTLKIIIPNTQGIHARPAAKIATIAGQHSVALTIVKDEQTVNARSINQIALLGARQGDTLYFYAEGEDAAQALAAVQALADTNFGDPEPKTIEKTVIADANLDLPDGVIAGISASKGLAIGKVYVVSKQIPEISTDSVADTDTEQKRLTGAIEDAIQDLRALVEQSKKRMGKHESAIFEAHLLMLQDDDLQTPAKTEITNHHSNAAQAWWNTIQAMAKNYRQSDNAYLVMRANDIQDVGLRVLKKLISEPTVSVEIPDGSILVAADLTPSDTAQLDPVKVRGIVTELGGATSHTAILARSLGIPAVVGIGNHYTDLQSRQMIVMDGGKGWIYTHPTPDQITSFEQAIEQQLASQKQLIVESQQPAITLDNRKIEVAANIGKPADSYDLLHVGAEGVGLFRTELLFMDRPTPPTEEQQFEAYCEAAANLTGYPIIIRTLDVGGDKAIDYIHIAPEENPFLGYRGIRYWLNNPALARTQLRAIYRASATNNIKIMFPMVGTLDELVRAKALVESVQQELRAASIEFNPDMEIGIMIEVPSAVLIADQLAAQVDFFSIGTNDLTQYIMAADRGNAAVNSLANPLQPGVIRAIHQVVKAAHAAGKWVGMCGEMAGNPLATQLLIGLGLDELSMSAPSIPEIKAIIRRVSYTQAIQVAEHVLALDSATKIIEYLKQESLKETV